MAETDSELATLYTESANVLRHYSGLVLGVRNIVTVQGFAVAGVSGYLYREGLFAYAAAVSLLCFLQTLVLWRVIFSYAGHFFAILKWACQAERTLNPRESPQDVSGPWSAYEKERKTLTHRKLKKYANYYGTCILFLVVSATIFVASACRLWL
jgi:hypothetical protein